MSDIFEEVEESLRQDKATILWEKYGWMMYVVGGLIVAFVAAMEFMGSQESRAQVERVEVFESGRAALSEGKYAEAEKLFSEVVGSGSDLAPLAAHYLAQTRLEGGGDKAGAADALTATASSDDPFAQMAIIKAAYLTADTLSLEELETKLSGLLDNNGPASALALELIAAKAYEAGDFERARRDFAFLQVAPDAPPGVIARAEAALSVIPIAQDQTPELAAPKEATLTEEEAGQ